MEKMISSSPNAFIYMCELGLALTTHMEQCHQCNLILSSNSYYYLKIFFIKNKATRAYLDGIWWCKPIHFTNKMLEIR